MLERREGEANEREGIASQMDSTARKYSKKLNTEPWQWN